MCSTNSYSNYPLLGFSNVDCLSEAHDITLRYTFTDMFHLLNLMAHPVLSTSTLLLDLPHLLQDLLLKPEEARKAS